MAKKPRNYQPQQRRRTQETLPATPVDQSEHPFNPEEILSKLSELFELDAIASGDLPASFAGSMAASIQSSLGLLEWDEKLSKDELQALLPELIIAIRAAATELAEHGFDRIHSHEIIPRIDAIKLFKDAATTGMSNLESLQDFVNNNPTAPLDDAAMEAINGLQQTAYMRLLRVYMLSKRMSRVIKESEVNLDIYDDYRNGSIRRLEQEMTLNPTSVRRETTRTLDRLFSAEVSYMLEYYGYGEEPEQESGVSREMTSLPHQELDFTVLPTGIDLREFAEAIVDRLNDHDKARVDLDRIGVLNAIREYIGKDRCYFAHGKKTGRQMHDEESDTLIDEDYIVLVMQELSDSGTTTSEHALAISPIANKHAAYLTRNDVSAGSWREVLSLPKQDARYFGARDLRFTGSTGRTPYAMMEEKIKALLECHSDDFQAKLRMRGDGTYRLENMPREFGRSASKGLVHLS